MLVTMGPRFGTNVFPIWIDLSDQPVNYIFSIISEGVVKRRLSSVVFEEKIDAVALMKILADLQVSGGYGPVGHVGTLSIHGMWVRTVENQKFNH